MIDYDPERLRTMGLTPALANHAAALAAAASDGEVYELMRLTVLHRESVQVHDGRTEHPARVLPRLVRRLLDDDTMLAVGDWVFVATDVHGDRWVHERITPLTQLVRRDADGRRHTVVSNVDVALLVMGLDGNFNLRRMERFLALVQGSGVQPVVVLSKADVVDARTHFDRVHQLRGRLPAGVDLVSVDTRDADAAARLAPYAQAGQTLVLMGSSGAGKSTLTNALLGEDRQATHDVRATDEKGRHTTTRRELLELPGLGWAIDTPGMRELGLWQAGEGIDETFEEIAALAQRAAILVAPNMSVAVTLAFKVLALMAKALGDAYDVEITETHHRFKKDAPSGTAVHMAEVIAEALGRDLGQVGVYGRHGLPGERTPKEIAVMSLRSGDVVGEHTVSFGTLGERLELTHRAHSRDTFARGALRAVQWMIGRPPGLYSMHDVLGIA